MNCRGNRNQRIFISYGHDEFVNFAEKLKTDLVSQGHDVWFDADSIKTGDDWEHYIEDGLNWVSKDVKGSFILLMTPHSVRRPDGFCLNELAMAILKGIKIIPIMLVFCEPPLSICRIQWLDMTGCMPLERGTDNYEAKFKILLKSIEQDKLNFEGFQSVLINALNPLSFDAEIKSSISHFVGRKWVFDEIDDWMNSNRSRVFWIAGNPGVGKTAISAWLCQNRREIAAFHFCRYDNVQKMDPRRCVMSLAYQLSTQLPDYEERLRYMKLDQISDLNAKTLFDNLVVQPLSGIPRPDRTIVMLIDALDEATIDGKNELVTFVTTEFERTPEWLKLIVTSRPDPDIMGSMQSYTPFVLDASDIRNVPDIRTYLERELQEYYGEAGVPESTIDAIVEKSGGLFLYAEWIVRELGYGRLSLDKLDEFPQGLGGIYHNFFARQFPNIETWESKVRPALETIFALQEPVDIKSFSSFFGWSVHDERKFRMALGSLFKFDRGMVQPFHKSVVEWLTNDDKNDPYYISVNEGHRILAEIGLKTYRSGKNSWTPYLLSYLPTHLCIAGKFNELREVLDDVEFIKAEWDKDKFNVLKQWTFIEGHSPIKMLNVYGPISRVSSGEEANNLLTIVKLLENMYHLDEALRILDHLVAYYKHNGDVQGLQESIGIQAWIRYTKSDYDRAMGLFREQEKICREIGNVAGLQYSIHYQANILSYKNDFDVAMELFKEDEKICRDNGNKNGLLDSLGDQCLILRCKGDYDGVLKTLKETEKIYEETRNRNGLLRCLHEQGLILRALGNMDDAMSIFKKQEKISREICNKDLLRVSLTAQERILLLRGELDAAMALNKEAEQICRQIGNQYDLQDCIGIKALNLIIRGELDAALVLIDEEEKINKELGNKIGIQLCYGDRGTVYYLRGELDRAMDLFKEQEKICREIGHKRDLAMSLSNQANILRIKWHLNAAMTLHNEAVKTLREIGYKYGLQEALGNQAMTLYAMGDTPRALILLGEQENMCREMGAKLDLKKCVENQKIVAKEKERDLVTG